MDIEKFRKILDNCKDYTPLAEQSFPGGYRFQEFFYGEMTMETIMELGFECNRCGECCIDVGRKACGNLRDGGGAKDCSIYQIRGKYPIACFTYPVIIDETFEEGYGRRYVGVQRIFGENEHWEFGLMSGALTLILHPAAPCWGEGRPIREHYLKVLEAMNKGLEGPLHPPHETLAHAVSLVDGQSKTFKPEELEEGSRRFHEVLRTKKMRNDFDIKRFKIKHRDYSLGL